MPRVTVHIVNAFLDGGTGGNGAGVVLDAEGLTREQKQAIAAEIALSETAFVLPSVRADFRVEFFTPVRQVPHCGHATVATYHLLAKTGRVSCDSSSKESVEDVRRILYRPDGVYMEQKKPVYRALDDGAVKAALAAAGAHRALLHPGAPPAVVSTGNPWIIFGLEDEAALAALEPDPRAIAALSEEQGIVGFYLFALPPNDAAYTAAARMFAPAYGVDEESATGSAAGPLGCYLYERMGGMPKDLTIRQGHLMRTPSTSRLRCRLNVAEGAVQNLLVGGEAAVAGTREVVIA